MERLTETEMAWLRAGCPDPFPECGMKTARILSMADVLLRRVKSELETDPHAEDYYSSLINDISDYLRGK